MMKANELRIGNWINFDSGVHGDPHGVNEHFQVTAKWLNDFDNVPEDSIDWLDYFTPIQLTEEWLEKFGFKNNMLSVYKGALKPLVFAFEFVDEPYGSFWIGEGLDRMLLEIKYVHQLQNLYYALTGEELETKEK